MHHTTYGAVERRHCDWNDADDAQASAAAAAARLFADSNRHCSPLLLTGFASALGWSAATERWGDPEYLRMAMEGRVMPLSYLNTHFIISFIRPTWYRRGAQLS